MLSPMNLGAEITSHSNSPTKKLEDSLDVVVDSCKPTEAKRTTSLKVSGGYTARYYFMKINVSVRVLVTIIRKVTTTECCYLE